jgi:gas vesicle protein
MRRKVVAASAVLLAGAGYVAGLLTAPKSGKETRNDISKSASKARIEAEKKLKKLHSELQDLIDEGEVRSKKLKSKAKQELDDAIIEAKRAKEKARELLSAIHHGDADDPNLQAVINEVKLAQKNLVTFLKKK